MMNSTVDFRARGYPNLKGWLSWDGTFLVGPRYIKLLEGVERTGSIRAACGTLGLSYRTCLDRIRQMERTLGTEVLATRRGGNDPAAPSSLPPLANSCAYIDSGARKSSRRASRRTRGRPGGGPRSSAPNADSMGATGVAGRDPV